MLRKGSLFGRHDFLYKRDKLTSVDSQWVEDSQPLGWGAQGRKTPVTYLPLPYLLFDPRKVVKYQDFTAFDSAVI